MTDLDLLAERYYDAHLQLSPIELTSLGSTERQDEYDDLSPTGLAERAALAKRTLAELATLQPTNANDEVTAAALRERLELDLDWHEANIDSGGINGIASGLHDLRQVYELMPLDTDEELATAARRMQSLPAAIEGWFASQRAAIDAGVAPASRQVDLLATQTKNWVAEGGYFDDLQARMTTSDDALASDIAAAIATAKQAYADASARLIDEIAPLATDVDAVGIDRYRLASQAFLGTRVDLAETYAWGQAEVARLDAAQEAIARDLGHSSVAEAKAALDDDPRYVIEGTDALKAWMQTKADEAIAALHPTHFDIAEPLRRIEAMIAPSTDGGIWYTQPSEDFSRPGRMWWSVPEGVTRFGTWQELTTVYHEGVPGHHLQLAQALYRSDELNRWRRSGIWVSGHGEGWALYAEQLMAELGFLDDPGNLLGMLDSQALRAVRVVIDIGVHCGFDAPANVGGGAWTMDKARDYFNAHVNMEPNNAQFELNRYFGWPGQAPSYKIGARLWEELRTTARQRQGADFDLARFHARALNLGSVGLDVLRAAVLA